MMIEAEFEEIEGEGEDELDLSSEDSLPWLESDEDEAAGGYDFTQFLGFGVILLALLGAMVGGIWFLTNRTGDAATVADGSTIEAPEGPYKERPDDPGGKEFAGTGNVAPVVGEGQTREGVMADGAESGSGTTDGASRSVTDTAASTGSSGSSASETGGGGSTGDGGATSGSSATSGSVVGVQVGAYGSRARAEAGWQTLLGSSDALSGVRYRIVKGEADIGTVYRLQALASNRTAADQLCNALKADGLPCQVKP